MNSTTNKKTLSRVRTRAHRGWLTISGALVGLGSIGCDSRSLEVETDQQPQIGSEPDNDDEPTRETLGKPRADVLFVVDNTGGMRHKQRVLESSMEYLLWELAGPRCVDVDGDIATIEEPGESCPTGYSPVRAPILDINVGLITSSIGDAGADQGCAHEEANDNAHLIGTLPRGQSLELDDGVLRYREGDDWAAFVTQAQNQLSVTGESGCGYEAPLEALHRFVSDPAPWQRAKREDCEPDSGRRDCVVADGVDQAVLEQRDAFFRDDSTVIIVMLTDENDCSIKVGHQNWVVANINNDFRMFAASEACATDPDDACCYSCGMQTPDGCPEDPTCFENAEIPHRLPKWEDEPALRCWDNKRRFGADFLYPIERYIVALTSPTLCLAREDLDPTAPAPDPRDPDAIEGCTADDPLLVDNPLFRRTDPSSGETLTIRAPEQVLLAGLVGVPWQLLEADTSQRGTADDQLTLLSAAQLRDPTLSGNPARTSWSSIAPTDGSPPTDVHMHESIAPRPALPGSTAAAHADAFHGHERNIDSRNSLQFACTFELPEPRVCDDPDAVDCPCAGDWATLTNASSPLCQTGEIFTNTQLASGAWPGLRQLEVLRQLGDQAAVGSICSPNTSNPDAGDFAYDAMARAVGAWLDARH